MQTRAKIHMALLASEEALWEGRRVSACTAPIYCAALGRSKGKGWGGPVPHSPVCLGPGTVLGTAGWSVVGANCLIA